MLEAIVLLETSSAAEIFFVACSRFVTHHDPASNPRGLVFTDNVS